VLGKTTLPEKNKMKGGKKGDNHEQCSNHNSKAHAFTFCGRRLVRRARFLELELLKLLKLSSE
jgi:hypothetical protein